MIEKQMRIIAESLVRQKEKIIRDAIDNQIGSNWEWSDIQDRGKYTLFRDGTQTFSLDGIDLIHFLLAEPKIELVDDRHIFTVELKYEILA